MGRDKKRKGAKFIFHIKQKADGTLGQFKAQYVARGFNQRVGIDFNKTYAPTVSLGTLRLLLTLASRRKLQMVVFNISGAYLYSPMKETVYV